MTARVVITDTTGINHAAWEGAVPDMGDLILIDERAPDGPEHTRLRVTGRQWRVTRTRDAQGAPSEGVLTCFVFVVQEMQS